MFTCRGLFKFSFFLGRYLVPSFAHCTRNLLALVVDEPQLHHPSFAQAQAAKDAENHATPPQEQPQTQPEVQVQPQAEPLTAPPSHSEVIFFLFKLFFACCGLLVVALLLLSVSGAFLLDFSSGVLALVFPLASTRFREA